MAATVDWYVRNRDWSDRVLAAKGEFQIDWATAAQPSAAR
jgi:hypothetical protein